MSLTGRKLSRGNRSVADTSPRVARKIVLPVREPAGREVRIRVAACGVCHTELDEIEGRTPPPKLPVVLGHEVIGNVDALGRSASKLREGTRVGVGWIRSST